MFSKSVRYCASLLVTDLDALHQSAPSGGAEEPGEGEAVGGRVTGHVLPAVWRRLPEHDAHVDGVARLLPFAVQLLPVHLVPGEGKGRGEAGVIPDVPVEAVVVAQEAADGAIEFRLEEDGVDVDPHEVAQQRLHLRPPGRKGRFRRRVLAAPRRSGNLRQQQSQEREPQQSEPS
jgi:hypothetical protein